MDYNQTFKWCVNLLRKYAHKWNMTYEELNVWLFCIIEPLIFFFMIVVIFVQWRRISKLKKK